MATQIEVAQVVAMIGSAYPSFNASKETVTVYFELLKDLPVDLLKASALQCCAESGRKFAPSVGEIRGAAEQLNRKAQGIPSPLEAWNETRKAPYHDYSRIPMFDGEEFHYTDPNPHQWSHPIVERVARLMGWPDFPDPKNEAMDRAHFFKQYEAEVEAYTSSTVEVPEVTRYIEGRRNGKALPIGKALKQLEAK